MTTPTLPAEKVLKGSRAYWSLLAQATAVSKLNSHVQLYFCLHHNTENTSKPCPQRVEYYSRFPTQNHLYFFFFFLIFFFKGQISFVLVSSGNIFSIPAVTAFPFFMAVHWYTLTHKARSSFLFIFFIYIPKR